jgi:hypothetical protein
MIHIIMVIGKEVNHKEILLTLDRSLSVLKVLLACEHELHINYSC